MFELGFWQKLIQKNFQFDDEIQRKEVLYCCWTFFQFPSYWLGTVLLGCDEGMNKAQSIVDWHKNHTNHNTYMLLHIQTLKSTYQMKQVVIN